MANGTPHTPDLAALEALNNQEIRFYAIIGAVMSLTARLELAYFDIFRRATSLRDDVAAAMFYEIKNSSTRRDMAGKALAKSLPTSMTDEWQKLYGRIIQATGNSGQRNLLGHGQVSVARSESGGSGMLGFGPLGAGPIGSGPEVREEYIVKQDETQILAGTKRPQQADFEALIAYCREVIALTSDLTLFLQRVP